MKTEQKEYLPESRSSQYHQKSNIEQTGISALMGGSTSDHLPREMVFDFDEGIKIKAATWNMMNIAHPSNPKDSRSYSNNPLNYDESKKEGEYKIRKNKQLNQLLGMMEDNDCIFLQETDVFVGNVKKPYKPKTMTDADYKSLQEIHTQRIQLQSSFFNNMASKGWGVVFSPAFQHGMDPTKKMVTLYNKKVLTNITNTNKGVLPVNKGKKTLNTGFENTFTFNDNNKRIKLTNVHLDFVYPGYKKDLPLYMKKSQEPVIIGGDTNHSLSYDLPYLISDFSHPSSFDSLSHKKDGKNLSTIRRDGKNMSLDGFMTCSKGIVEIYEKNGKAFKIANGAVQVYDYQCYPKPHISKPGQPWFKEKLVNVNNAPPVNRAAAKAHRKVELDEIKAGTASPTKREIPARPNPKAKNRGSQNLVSKKGLGCGPENCIIL